MKKLRQLDLIESDVIHSPFFPEEIRENDGLTADLLKDGKWMPARVWRYSPFGIEIIWPDHSPINQNTDYSLRISFLEEQVQFDSIKVATINREGVGEIVGFRTFRNDETSIVSEDRRKTTRWSCATDMLPTGTAPNPLKFNDFIVFRVEDVSATGLKMVTSMRNKLLHKDQILETTISLPLVGNISCTLKLIYIDVVDRDDKQYLSIGTKFINPSEFLLNCFAEYLLHFGKDVSTSTLKKDGFPLRSENRNLDFSYVKSKWEYENVLALRRVAYSAADKVPANITAKEMADEYDSRARILIVKRDQKVVGSIRAIFHTNYKESELFKDGVKSIPNVFMEEGVEASRFCTEPSLRGIDIAVQLLTHLSLTTIKAGKRYIYAGATGFMLDFFQKIGWTISEQTYSCGALRDIPHKAMYVDIHDVVLGKNVSPRYWKRAYKNLFYHLYERELIFPSKLDLLRVKLYSIL